MAAVVIIPARFGSTRFPGKILASETGRPLVQHVVDRARQCQRVMEVIVATDDERIVRALTPYKTRCVMTALTHVSGTDRIAELAPQLPGRVDMVVNVQGDEPEIEPATIDALIARLDAGEQMATAATPFPESADPHDPNLVKVVVSLAGRALYFSRSPIPFYRYSAESPITERRIAAYDLHQGIYAYQRDFLMKFSAWKPTPLELAEKLEQLRVLEHGHTMYVLKTERVVHGIDTAEQYAAFVKRYRQKGPMVEKP